MINEIAEIKNRFKNYVIFKQKHFLNFHKATRDDVNSIKDDVDYLLKEIRKLQEKLEVVSKEFYFLKNEDLPPRFLELKKEIQKIYEILKNLKNNDGASSNANTEASALDINLIQEFNDKLGNKVNCEDFDKLLNEIALLHERINGLSTNNNKPRSMTDVNKEKASMMTSKDSNMLKDLAAKYNDLEGLLKKLQK